MIIGRRLLEDGICEGKINNRHAIADDGAIPLYEGGKCGEARPATPPDSLLSQWGSQLSASSEGTPSLDSARGGVYWLIEKMAIPTMFPFSVLRLMSFFESAILYSIAKCLNENSSPRNTSCRKMATVRHCLFDQSAENRASISPLKLSGRICFE